ncbi:MAG: metal-dependent hydrolase [Candidatus Heimdallarchaeota archaeon]|nr:metal-dependent hydrolase [Candidatus Heimdallarchaeota archaeon]
MQGGVHLLSGLVIASFSKRKMFKLGAVLGAILPDIDIILIGPFYFIYGATVAELHRTFTHSLFMVILLSGLIASLGYVPFVKKRFPDFDFVGLALGIGVGMFLHIFLDMFYFYGIQFLWPFSDIALGCPLISEANHLDWVGCPLITQNNLDPAIPSELLKLKLIQTTDFYTDIFFFYIPMIILAYKKGLHKKARLAYLIYAIIDFLVITFFVVLAFNPTIGYEKFIVYLYIPGISFLLLSILAPLFFKDVIREFKLDKQTLIIILSLFVFSQFLLFV